MNVVWLESEVSKRMKRIDIIEEIDLEPNTPDREVEGDTASPEDVVCHQSILKLPGNLPDVLQHRVPLLSR